MNRNNGLVILLCVNDHIVLLCFNRSEALRIRNGHDAPLSRLHVVLTNRLESFPSLLETNYWSDRKVKLLPQVSVFRVLKLMYCVVEHGQVGPYWSVKVASVTWLIFMQHGARTRGAGPCLLEIILRCRTFVR